MSSGLLAYHPTQVAGQRLDVFAANPGQVNRELLATQSRIFVVGRHRLDVLRDALEHLIANVVAVDVVDLLEVVDVDHRQVVVVFPRHAVQLQACAGHERTAIGDFGEGVDVGLVQQQPGHDEVVELGLVQRQEAVEGQAADKCRVTEGHHAPQFKLFDTGVVEGIEKPPGHQLRGKE
ncbi:hypothetical protein D3C81_633020 [compost metagenome]